MLPQQQMEYALEGSAPVLRRDGMELLLPLFVGSQQIGLFLATATAGFRFTESHLALALEVTRDPHWAQASAEQALLAWEAAEATHANLVLRRCVDRMAQAKSIEDIFDALLAEAICVSGAAGGTILRGTNGGGFEVARMHAGGRPLEKSEWHGQSLENQLRTLSAADPHKFWKSIATGKSGWYSIEETFRGWFDELIEFESKWGHRYFWEFSLSIGGEIAGVLCLSFTTAERPSETIHETVCTLAAAASMAVEILRLADSLNLAALAQEREQAAAQRVRELARIGAAGRAALARFAAQPALDSFLGHVLSTLIEQLEAEGGSIWRTGAAGDAELLITFDNGQLLAPPASGHPGANLTHFNPSYRLDFMLRDGLLIDDEAAIATREDYAPFREFLARHGTRTVISMPMYLGTERRGAITLRFPTSRTLNPEEVELLSTLANQATIAFELTRLADRAQRAALGEERLRLAHEIHDTLAQGLASIALRFEAIERQYPDAPPALLQSLESMKELARANLQETRRAMAAMRPRLLDAGFEQGLRQLVESSRQLTTASIELTLLPFPVSLPAPVEDQMIRLAQEAVSNAIRHGQPNRIGITLRKLGNNAVQLSIEDDGIGFDPDQPVSGYGIAGMHERAARAGLSLTLVSEPGAGTQVVMVYSPAQSNS